MAATPVSAISSADSSSSYSASSMRAPVKTCAMPAPVLRRPWRRRLNQPAAVCFGHGCRHGRFGGHAEAATGRAAASPGTAAAGAAAAGGGFFLKKLNIGRERVAGAGPAGVGPL